MMWHDGGWGAGTWVLMSLLMIAFWTVVVVGVVWLVRGSGRAPTSTGPSAAGGSARRILDERLARGEISEEEYRQRRATLSER